MHLSNLHTHTDYCDGTCSAEEMVESAVQAGFHSIGISTHGPVTFETDWNIKHKNIEKYIDEILLLKEKYRNIIEIYLGMELDYLPRTGFDKSLELLIKRLDYYIGSVHFLGELSDGTKWTVDYNLQEIQSGIKDSFGGSTRLAVETYFSMLAEMAEMYEPPIIGHFDLIKKLNKNNILFDENSDWYIKSVVKCLDVIKNTESAVEINTGGIIRGYTEEQYPSTFILKLIRERGIPVTVSSDAHSKEAINGKFTEMYRLIKSIGFKNIRHLTKNGWIEKEI